MVLLALNQLWRVVHMWKRQRHNNLNDDEKNNNAQFNRINNNQEQQASMQYYCGSIKLDLLYEKKRKIILLNQETILQGLHKQYHSKKPSQDLWWVLSFLLKTSVMASQELSFDNLHNDLQHKAFSLYPPALGLE